MKKLELETLVGRTVILTCIVLALVNVRASAFDGFDNDRYVLAARFGDVGGLAVNSPVRSAGVTVGHVISVELDPTHHLATVTLDIEGGVRFPADSMAQVLNAGLLGESYVAIQPGADGHRLRPGDMVTRTQSAMVLEQVIQRFVERKKA